MKQVIYKYPLENGYQNDITVPEGSKVLCVQTQSNQPQVWILIPLIQDPKVVTIRLQTMITGSPFELPEGSKYIGIYQLDDGHYAGHVFQIPVLDS